METWCSIPNKGKEVVVYFSRAFDKLSHSLLFCKLKAYGFDKNALIFNQGYFQNRLKRTTVSNEFREWQKI